MRVCISAGHSSKCRGAAGPAPWGLDEVDEARKVVTAVAKALRTVNVGVETYFDDVSDDQDENLKRICDWHNSRTRDWDFSVHFNSADFNGSNQTSNPVGSEMYYQSQTGFEMADELVDAVCEASGLKNRGPKEGNLYFLSHTEEPAVLLEICFVNSKADVDIYHKSFDLICNAIAGAIAGEEIDSGGDKPEPEPPPDPDRVLFYAEGKCSHFGGPDDTGVSPSEGLAFIYKYEEAPYLFLPKQPPGTTGLARRLDPEVFYVACRWDYDESPKTMLRDSGQMARVIAKRTGVSQMAYPADWGPNENTGRVADLSPGLMEFLGIATDDEVEVTYPDSPHPVPDVQTVTITIEAPPGIRIVVNGQEID